MYSALCAVCAVPCAVCGVSACWLMPAPARPRPPVRPPAPARTRVWVRVRARVRPPAPAHPRPAGDFGTQTRLKFCNCCAATPAPRFEAGGALFLSIIKRFVPAGLKSTKSLRLLPISASSARLKCASTLAQTASSRPQRLKSTNSSRPPCNIVFKWRSNCLSICYRAAWPRPTNQ